MVTSIAIDQGITQTARSISATSQELPSDAQVPVQLHMSVLRTCPNSAATSHVHDLGPSIAGPLDAKRPPFLGLLRPVGQPLRLGSIAWSQSFSQDLFFSNLSLKWRLSLTD